MNTDWLTEQLTNTTERVMWVRDSVKAFTYQQYLGKFLEPRAFKTLYLFLIAFTRARKTGPFKYKDIKTKNNIIDAISPLITKVNKQTKTKWASTHRPQLLEHLDQLKKYNFVKETPPQEIKAEYPWMKDIPIPKRGKGLHYMPGYSTFFAATFNPEDPVASFHFKLEQVIHYLGIIVLPEHPELRRELMGELEKKKPMSEKEKQAQLVLALAELNIFPQKLREELNNINFQVLEEQEELFSDHPLVEAVLNEKKVNEMEKGLEELGISIDELYEKSVNSQNQKEIIKWLIDELGKAVKRKPSLGPKVKKMAEYFQEHNFDIGGIK